MSELELELELELVFLFTYFSRKFTSFQSIRIMYRYIFSMHFVIIFFWSTGSTKRDYFVLSNTIMIIYKLSRV